jgi:hypothetical protein
VYTFSKRERRAEVWESVRQLVERINALPSSTSSIESCGTSAASSISSDAASLAAVAPVNDIGV